MSAVAMQSFGFGEQLVRVVERAGSAWFVGNDVCAALEIGNSSMAVRRLDEDERDEVNIVDAIGREQRTTIVSEAGVFALIFTSRKAAAKQFKRWVTHEVLPAIRATGRFVMDAAGPSGPTLETPDEFDLIRTKLALAKEARIVFGVKAARRAWAELALLPGLTDDMPTDTPMLSGVVAQIHGSITDWMDARCEYAPGHRWAASQVYNDYVDWARAEKLDASEIVSATGFGRALSNLGIASIHSVRRYRVGLKPKG